MKLTDNIKWARDLQRPKAGYTSMKMEDLAIAELSPEHRKDAECKQLLYGDSGLSPGLLAHIIAYIWR